MYIEAFCVDFFGKRLKKIRKKSGLSQETLAKELGISKSALSYYENGERVPDIIFLEKVAHYYNISLDYMLGFSDAMNPEKSSIVDKTGLSEETIDTLMNEFDDGYISNILDKLIRNEDFRHALQILESESHNFRESFGNNYNLPPRYTFVSPSYAEFIVGKLIMDAVAKVLKDRWEEISIDLMHSLLSKQQREEYYNWVLNDRSFEDRIKEFDRETTESRSASIQRWKEETKTRDQAIEKLYSSDVSKKSNNTKDGESNG